MGLVAWMLGAVAWANPPEPSANQDKSPPPTVADLPDDVLVKLSFSPEASLYDFVLFIGPLKRVNFVLGDPEALQQTELALVAPTPMSIDDAWETFLTTLDDAGFRLELRADRTATIVKKQRGLPEVAPTVRTGD